MKKFLLLAVALFTGHLCMADKQQKADAETAKFLYDIEYARTAGDGMCQVKVWSYSKTTRIASAPCRKNAVHGVIFKGYATGDGSSTSQRPLVKEAAALQRHAEFFEEFFSDGGAYRQFVSAVTDGSMEVKRIGERKQYKVGVVVTVSKDQLRKYLEENGVIRSLGSGF